MNKKILSLLIVIFILKSVMCLSCYADAVYYTETKGIDVQGSTILDTDEEEMKYVASTGTTINLREGPGTNYAVLYKIPNFSGVWRKEIYKNWARIYFLDNYTGLEYDGWLFTDHLLDQLPIKAEQFDVVVKAHSGGGLNFREGPATSYSKLQSDLIPDGQILHVTKVCSHERCDHSWGYVTYNNLSGWVCLWETERCNGKQVTSTPQTTTQAMPIVESTVEPTLEPQESVQINDTPDSDNIKDTIDDLKNNSNENTVDFDKTIMILLLFALGLFITIICILIIILMNKKK